MPSPSDLAARRHRDDLVCPGVNVIAEDLTHRVDQLRATTARTRSTWAPSKQDPTSALTKAAPLIVDKVKTLRFDELVAN